MPTPAELCVARISPSLPAKNVKANQLIKELLLSSYDVQP